MAFFSETVPLANPPFESSTKEARTEFCAGAGIAKNGWKVRTGINFSVSNFSFSNQERGEGYITFLPSGNLNFYLTSGGMIQTDMNWGNTYQVNEEIGIRIFNSVWLESGIVFGNSFLYTRNQGYLMNNSFLIPSTTLYCNIIVSPGKRYEVTLSPFYSENKNYSWDLNVYNRTNELNPRSYGLSVKLNYNKR